jgi:VWFA-related protein
VIRLGTAALVAALALPGHAADPGAVTVNLAEPDLTELLSGHAMLRAEVEAGRRSVTVSFVVDGTEIANDREAPYEALWAKIDPLRDHLIRVTATANDGSRAYDLYSVPILGPIERISVTGRTPDFVLVNVTFLNSAGMPVVDVKKEEVEVLEDDKPQSIEVFAPDDRPMAVELLLDASGSTQPFWKDLGEAASLFAQTLRPSDRATIVAFNNKFTELAPLGSSADQLRAATEKFDGWGGSTRLYDALARGALFNLAQEDSRRRTLIVLTDAIDLLQSTLDGSDADVYLRRSEVEMHAVLLTPSGGFAALPAGASSEVMWRRALLQKIAQTSGGGSYDNAATPLPEIFLRIGERLRAQYLLGYTSESGRKPGAERQISVRLKRPGSFQARARANHFGGQTLIEYLAAETARGPERRRAMAVQTAAMTNDPVALKAVVAALAQGKDTKAGVAREARLALLDMGPSALPWLKQGLASTERDVRPRAAEVIVDLLSRLSQKEDRAPFEQALAALGDGSAAAGREMVRGLGEFSLPSEARFRLEELIEGF